MFAIFNLQGIWDNQGSNLKHRTVKHVRTTLHSNYKSSWLSHLNGGLLGNCSPKLRTYKLFKTVFKIENYLLFKNIPLSKRIEFSKLRVSAHKLRIETDRYIRPRVPPENRLCLLCDSGVVEDEKHFMLECELYNRERRDLVRYIQESTDINSLNVDDKFNFLMSCSDYEVSKTIIDFVNFALDIRKKRISENM